MSPIEVAGIGAVAVAATAPIVGMFVPNVYEVRAGAVKVDQRGLRHALAMGAAVALGVGIAAALATRSPLPIAGSILGVFIVVAIYEWSVRNPSADS